MAWHRKTFLAISATGVASVPFLANLFLRRTSSHKASKQGAGWWNLIFAESHPTISQHQSRDRRKIVVLVDMDNTIADFDEHALKLLRERHGSVFDIDQSSLTKFPLAANFPEPEHKLAVTSLLFEENFFRSFKPIQGAIQGLKEMQAHPYVEVFLCTAPIRRNKFCASEKIEWVRHHLGDDWVGRVIITSDKSLVYGDLLIDDAPEAKGDTRTPDWEHVWFAMPYNIGLKGRRHLRSWSEWRDIVLVDGGK